MENHKLCETLMAAVNKKLEVTFQSWDPLGVIRILIYDPKINTYSCQILTNEMISEFFEQAIVESINKCVGELEAYEGDKNPHAEDNIAEALVK